MLWFLQSTLSNTLFAAILALFALLVSRTVRRPALSHALWLLVLLKLITPPLYNIPLPVIPSDPPPVVTHQPMAFDLPELPLVATDPIPYEEPPQLTAPAAPPPTPAPNLTWHHYLLLTWLTGSLLCLAIILLRLHRFCRLLHFALPAPTHLQNLTRSLSHQIGLARSPQVFFIPGPLYPMLFAFTRQTKLLIPTQLWSRLDEAQRQTLLLHELAHYRRRDHLIRALELLVTIIYWWNPIAHLARRELREAEEQCCDAWVTSTLPRSSRDYAIALMEAIDFVSTARPAVPILASPMGEFHDLKRRLLMIRHESSDHRRARALGWTTFTIICLVAALLLPLSASLAQVGPAAAPANEPALPQPQIQEGDIFTDFTGPQLAQPIQPAQRGQPAQIAQPAQGANTAQPGLGDPIAMDEARTLEEELAQTRDEINRLTVRLRTLQTRMTQLHNARIERQGNRIRRGDVGLPGEPADPSALATALGAANIPRKSATNPPATSFPRNAANTANTVNTDQQEQRLRTVEDKLDLLIDELRAIRNERNNRNQDRPGGLQGR